MHILIYNHIHEDSKYRIAEVQKRLTNDLDFDEAGDVIDECSENLEFVCTLAGHVWYEQTEAMILYVRDETEMELWEVGPKFNHLTPPDLREKYDIPSSRRY